jgi:phage shock protein C
MGHLSGFERRACPIRSYSRFHGESIMTCSRCLAEVPELANYCPSCGAAQHEAAAGSWRSRRLTRSRTGGMLAGVCAGIAEYFHVDVTLVRALWLVFSIVPGAVIGGIIAYVLAWLIMPESSQTTVIAPQARRLTRSMTDRKIAGVCGGLAEYFNVDATPVRLLWLAASILPGCIVGGVLAYLAAWLIIPKAGPMTLTSTPSPAAPTPA